MWGHLQEYFPVDCELMGEIQARRVIRHGIERADAHGFTTKGELCRYIDLSLSLGTDFDRDPQLPWAAEILATGKLQGARDTMAALFARALLYVEKVAGEDGERYQQAMARAQAVTFERVVDAEVISEGGFQTQKLTEALGEFAPVHGRKWRGGMIDQPISTASELSTHLEGYLKATDSSIILRVRGGAHWVIVDEVLPDGRIVIRDPAEQVSTVVTSEQLSSMGPTGEAVFSFPEKKQ